MDDNSSNGYGRPPLHSRFKPGQSGNPRGRPKGSRNFTADLAEELSTFVVLNKEDAPASCTKQQAIARSIVDQAVKGDARCFGLLLPLILKMSAEMVEDEQAAEIDKKVENRIAAGPESSDKEGST